MSKALLTAACLVALSMPASAAAPKDYYFPEVRVDISIASDGTFLVDEYRTFEFEGSFSYAYIVIPLRVERSGRLRDPTNLASGSGLRSARAARRWNRANSGPARWCTCRATGSGRFP